MKNNWPKIIIVLIVLAVLGFGVYFLYQKYYSSSNKNSKNVNNSGLPGKLFGAISPNKAEKLDPVQVIYWTNKYRADNNLGALKENQTLTIAAQKKVDDMFAKQYFEHVSPIGQTPAELVAITGYQYKSTGENLALGDFKDEKELVDAWMASPGHRANILNADYTEIGVATGLNTFEDRGKTWLSVQEFGKPMPNCAKPDQNVANTIESKRTQLNNLNIQINNLSTEASSLNSQANAKIQQGNEIYSSTQDIAQAQPLWNEGQVLKTQADNNFSQAKEIQAQAETLANDIKNEALQYNVAVESYNTCIAQ